MSETHRPIEEIEDELRLAKMAQAAEREILRDSCKPEYVWTLEPVGVLHRYDRIFDDTIQQFDLKCRCTNRKATEAVGNNPMRDGSGTYLFNTGTGKLIGHFGGGTFYIGNGFGRGDMHDYESETMEKINAFLATHPKGGNITEIILAHRAAKGVS